MRWWLPMLVGLATLMLSIGGCSGEISDPACPTIVEYDTATQAKAAAELRAMEPGVVRDRFVPDYGRLRDQVRACRDPSFSAPVEKLESPGG